MPGMGWSKFQLPGTRSGECTSPMGTNRAAITLRAGLRRGRLPSLSAGNKTIRRGGSPDQSASDDHGIRDDLSTSPPGALGAAVGNAHRYLRSQCLKSKELVVKSVWLTSSPSEENQRCPYQCRRGGRKKSTPHGSAAPCRPFGYDFSFRIHLAGAITLAQG